MKWITRFLASSVLVLAQSGGPPTGSLVVVGGGQMGPEIIREFVKLAGGADVPYVVIPTAGERDDYSSNTGEGGFLRRAGCRNITVLHTRDRQVADSEQFVAPLKQARAVFFPGGRQWRLVDAYLGTRTQRELEAVLARGGVIGGSSAGATIQGSLLVRGARSGNTIMMDPAYLTGFGYLRRAAVDQHLLKRGREKDLLAVIDKVPEVLGIGIDEGTAIVVRGNTFEVIGCSMVAVYDHGYRPEPGKPRYYFLTPGDRFDLDARRRIN